MSQWSGGLDAMGPTRSPQSRVAPGDRRAATVSDRLRHPSRRAVLGYASGSVHDPDRDTLVRLLDDREVPFELFPCDPALADTAAFCAAYGFALEDSANTIVVVGKSDPPRYAACVVLATHRLDVNRVVRGRLGTRKASFASPDETRALTGMEIGGVTAFGLPETLPLWVDAAVMARERIVLGGGSRSWKVLAPPSILLTVPGAEVVEGLAAPARPPA
jgi:prolyl-tRNA editing enzyme YbaK/EbsC (Cys-tRNA(Pro) deacylase)